LLDYVTNGKDAINLSFDFEKRIHYFWEKYKIEPCEISNISDNFIQINLFIGLKIKQQEQLYIF